MERVSVFFRFYLKKSKYFRFWENLLGRSKKNREIFKNLQKIEGNLKNIVGYTDDPIVSSDVIGCSETMLYDAKATMITANKLLKTVCWYDNGWGFAALILELIKCYQELENVGDRS